MIMKSVLAAAVTLALASSAAGAEHFSKTADHKVENAPNVLVLSENTGEAAWALFSAGATQVSPKRAELDQKMIVYVDVNSAEIGEKEIEVLAAARHNGNMIIFESVEWSVAELHALVGAIFPDLRLSGLQNVALAIVSEKGRSRAIDLTPSQAATMIGVPYYETDEGRAELAERSSRAAVHFLANFANSAYQTNPAHTGWARRINQDVLKIWRKTNAPNINTCIIAFRGTNSVGDWLRNGESQFGLSERPWASYSGTARIGHGYRSRLDNLWATIIDNTSDCVSYHVTGHSLGGALTEAGAFRLRLQNNKTIGEVVAFNPARVGNSDFRTTFLAQNFASRVQVFCRHGDPVWYVPLGLQHVADGTDGCTTWGDRASWLNLVTNHDMSRWL